MELRVNPARVRQARVYLGYSQQALAHELGCAVRTVQQWEAADGTSLPRGTTLRLLAEKTGRPVSWFFETDEAAA